MTPEEQAMLTCAELAVKRFARRCMEHEHLEVDPVCVIATVREQYLQELRSDAHERIMVTTNPKQHVSAAMLNEDADGRTKRNGHAVTRR